MTLFKKKKIEQIEPMDLDSIMKKYDRESTTRIWIGTPKIVVTSILALFSLMCIYVTFFATWLDELRLATFMAYIILIGYLVFPAKKGVQKTNRIPWYDIVLMVSGSSDDGYRLSYICFNIETTYEDVGGEVSVERGVATFNFYDHGITVVPEINPVLPDAPDEPDPSEISTYEGCGIVFEYWSGFEFDGESYVDQWSGSSFNVVNADMDAESAAIYDSLDYDSFEQIFVPMYEQAGVELVEWDVRRINNEYTEFLVIETWIDYGGVELYEAELFIKLDDTTYAIISCFTIDEASDDFIGTIAYSVRFAE